MRGRPFHIVNFRSCLILGLGLMTTAFLSVVAWAYRAVGCTLYAVFLAGLVLSVLLFRRKRLFVPVTLALTAVLSAIVFSVSFVTMAHWRVPLDYAAEHAVAGEVASVRRSDSMSLVLDGLSVDGQPQKGALLLYMDDFAGTSLEFTRPGDKISFSARLSAAPLTDGLRVNANVYRSNVRYTAGVPAADVTFSIGEPGLRDRLKICLHLELTEQVGAGYADVAYGMLTGDKYALSEDIRDIFSVSGIGHILAVSGLHIGFLSGAVLFALKRTRPLTKFLATAGVLTAYLLFVGYSPSVVRAYVMCMIGLITLVNGKRRDGLSSLFLTMSVILLMYPLALYDVGFQMSCGAVFGILALVPLLRRTLARVRVPAFLAAPLSVSTAAQAGITPFVLLYFGRFPLYAVFVNVLLMPLMTLTFILLFLTAVITLMIPAASVLFKGSGLLLWCMQAVAESVTYLPLASIVCYVLPTVLIGYLLLFVMSDYFMLPKGKGWVTLACATVFVVLSVVPQQTFEHRYSILPVQAPGFNSIVSDATGVYLVGDCRQEQSLSARIRRLHIKKIDAIFLTSLTEQSAVQVVRFARENGTSAVYLPRGDYAGLRTLIASDVPVYIDDRDAPFLPLYDDGRFYGYAYDFGAGKALFASGARLPDRMDEMFAVIRSRGYIDAGANKIYISDFLYGAARPHEYTFAEYGTFAFEYLSGRVVAAR